MRGLVAVSVPTVLAFVCTCNHLQIASEQRRSYGWICQFLLFLAAIMSLWSWLMWQQGPMDYLDWEALLEGQYLRLRIWMRPELLAILCASCLVTCFGVAQFKSAQGLRTWIGVLGTLLLAQLFERAELANFNLPLFYGTALVCSLVVFGLWRLHLWKPRPTWGASTVICGLLCLATLGCFARLEWYTRPLLSARADNYVSMNTQDIVRALMTLGSLKDVPRFYTQRERLESFWLRQIQHDHLAENFVPIFDDDTKLRTRGTSSRLTFKPLSE